MKNTIKGFSFLFLIFFVTLGITACKNFVNAEEVREQIEKNIAYNNASSYKIHLESSIPGVGSFKSPTTGVTEKKVTDVFTVSYDPIPEYAFIEWKVTDKITGNPADGYLAFEDVGAESTTCTFVKAPESGIELCLCAVVTTRPKNLTPFPQWTSEGVNKDSRIQVWFTKPMDESSIYYDDNEISNIIDEKKITINDFLPEEGYPKYGYKKDGKHYWKNITIVDNASSEVSLLEHFKNPAFEDPKTFVIQAKTTLTEGTELLVTLDKDFACKETGESTEKLVTLKESIVWFYRVNDKTDNADPIISTATITNAANTTNPTLSSSSTSPTILKNGAVNLNLQVSDGGSGPASVFNFELEDIDTGEKKKVPVRFKSVIGSTAKYNSTYNFSVDDGNYKISKIIVSDRSSRTAEKTFSYCIGIDNNAPKVNSLSVVPYGFRDNYKGQLKYTYSVDSSEKNLSSVNIKYKESGSSESWDEIDADPCPLTSNNSYFRIADVEPGKNYDIYAEFCDKANNSTVTIYKNVETLPKPLNAASVNVERISEANKSDKFKFTWAKPEGNYSGIYITGTSIDRVVLDSNDTQEYTITASSFDTKYTYELYTVKGNGSNDVDRSAESVQKVIWSKPNKISTVDINVSLSYPRIVITTSNALSMKVYYKKSNETEYGNPEIVTTSTNINSTKKIGNLEPATSYDIKITRYNSTSGLESDPIFYKNMYTAPAMPENFQITTSGNTTNASATLTWNTPEGNFDNYTIEYTKYENSTENWRSQNIPKTENSYTISGLELLTKYRFRIKTVYKFPSSQTTLSSDYSAPAPVSTPPQAATFNCSFDETYNVNVEWSLPGKAPYIDNDSVIKLCYGASEDDVKAETKSVILEFNYNMFNFSFQPVATTLTRANIGLYNQNCYFAIKTTCKNSSDESVTSWSEVKSLLMPPNIKPYEISVSSTDTISSDSVIVCLKKPSGSFSWNRINLYTQTGNGEETLVGSIERTNSNANSNQYYVISDLSPSTQYTISAKTELNGFESYATTVNVTTPGTITGNLNLRISKPTNGTTLTVVWERSAIDGKQINGEDIEHVGIRYRRIDSFYWEYPEEWGGKVGCTLGFWTNGYTTDKGNSGQLNASQLSSGTYIIELVTYCYKSSKVQILSTNSVEYIVP